MTDTKSRVMLATDRDKVKADIVGWWMSEKLEGQRAFWDGGVTRGRAKASVPWANTDKDSRYVEEPISTGLWSRYGHVINAPDWFLDSLPNSPLDGELYAGVSIERRQELFSALRKLKPVESEWLELGIRYHIFDTFNLSELSPGYDVNGRVYQVPPYQSFSTRYGFLGSIKLEEEYALKLPHYIIQMPEQLDSYLLEITRAGGEGVMVRDPKALYSAGKRVRSLLKIKPLHDSEAVMIGWNSGRETDKGSKLLGKMGSLILRWTNPRGQEVIFELSGFTDAERELKWAGCEWATQNPGQRATNDLFEQCVHFPLGCKVNFTYRDLTRDGMPVEARFRRVRDAD